MGIIVRNTYTLASSANVFSAKNVSLFFLINRSIVFIKVSGVNLDPYKIIGEMKLYFNE